MVGGLRAALTAAALVAAASSAASEPGTFRNPILQGGYPDPSICRDGEHFYIVNSSFEYFPGLPIHASRDLVNWELVGYGLHRPGQASGAVNLVDVQSDGGIHAPTLRCRGGKYYIITTNVYLPPGEDAETEFVNFVITADAIEGPWSEPLVLEGAPGIDPDIFFDDDGRVWYVGTHSPEKPSFPGEGEIWLQEIDTDRWELKGERHFLWRGACGGVWVEGPHLYKRDGRYYLMVAEGGTSFNHAVMVAVADEITGPYVSNPRNPILTSRHLSYDFWVNSTGHADLFELDDGRWYMVTLGIRGDVQRRSNMGRETHLVPVRWEREPFWWQEVKTEWPVAAPDTGRVERTNPAPFADSIQQRQLEFRDDFDGETLALPWNFRRVPEPGTWSLDAIPGKLRLSLGTGTIGERQRASLLGFRQTESGFEYQVSMRFEPQADGEEAGLKLFQKDNNYLGFTVRREAGKVILRAELSLPENDAKRTKSLETLKSVALPDYAGEILLRVTADGSESGRYRLAWSLDGGTSFREFLETENDHLLSRGYTGAYLGLYATSNGVPSTNHADYDYVSYSAVER